MPEPLRLSIAFFGRRGAGRSSLITALAGNDAPPIEDPSGPYPLKPTELPALGPVALLDMPGLDGSEGLCPLVAARMLQAARLAVLVLDPNSGVGEPERSLLARMARQDLPVAVVANKSDTARLDDVLPYWEEALGSPILSVSARTGRGIAELRDLIGTVALEGEPPEAALLGELVAPGNVVVLVTPPDPAAPGEPADQALREILARDATALVVKEAQLSHALHQLGRRPDLVICDARAFRHVADALPWGVPLTSLSILHARRVGGLDRLVAGARALETLEPGDRLLVVEAGGGEVASEHLTERVEAWLGGGLDITRVQGGALPDDPGDYRLVLHCGDGMSGRHDRLATIAWAGVPVVSDGVLMAYCQGLLGRALEPLTGRVHEPDEEPLVTWSPV